MLLLQYRPSVRIMLEQPVSSWMSKQETFRMIQKGWSLCRVLVHQGLYGADLLKATHLWSNLSLHKVQTKATKEKKEKHAARIRRKNQRRLAAGKDVPVYYTKHPNGGFSGGKDLQSTARYPQRLVSAIFSVWFKWFTDKACQAAVPETR